jgi:DNA-binding transcriptional LysR family regulator
LERIIRLLNDIREVRAAASDGNLPHGEIRIGVAHALIEFARSEPVGEIRREFPKLALRLSTGWRHDLLERVRSGAFDAAVILLPEEEPLPVEVAGKHTGNERLVVVAPRRHGLPRVRKIQDLAGAQRVLNPAGCAARAGRTLLRADIDMVMAVETCNYELQLALVWQNRGLSLVPERILNRGRQRSRLRVLRVAGLEFPLIVWTVRREPLARSAAHTTIDPGLDRTAPRTPCACR